MAEALTQRAFADLAGVSHTAIWKALRAGHLVEVEGGRLDPAEAVNAHWLARHQEPRVPPVTGSHGAGAPAPAEPHDGLFSDWDSLRVDSGAADRLLAAMPSDRASEIGFLCLMTEGMRAAVAEAIEELRADHYAFGGACSEPPA
jgi:hypothetical protein